MDEPGPCVLERERERYVYILYKVYNYFSIYQVSQEWFEKIQGG